MKRRVVSFITALALCLSLCPTWALAADRESDTGLCPHHAVHTEECGYIPPSLGQDCTHEHDESCFSTETLCVHQHAENCYPEPDPDLDFGSEPEPSLCAHQCGEGSGCVTLALDCPHVHGGSCGYVPEDAGAPCGFVCRVCPIEALIGQLPDRVTPDNKDQVEEQLGAILALYAELSSDEQDQVDLSRCFDLQAQLDAANAPVPVDDGVLDFTPDEEVNLTGNKTVDQVNVVAISILRDMCGYNFTATKTDAFQVQSTGALRVVGGGTIASATGIGIKVLAGGRLYIDDPSLTVTGGTYGLDIASGATVELSGGTFTGGTAAIRAEDGDYSKLLKAGHDYFDASGNPVTDMANATTLVIKAQPKITWADNSSISVSYNGAPVEKSHLPAVTIELSGEEDFSQYLEYFYKKAGDTDYTKGLPTNAGTYDIVARLPDLPPNYHSASSKPITLTINKINPIIEAPKAAQPTYNRSAQALVTAGRARDGAVIEFARTANGLYSTAIPTETNAGSYSVWYKVEETENYNGVLATEIQNVQIMRKQITPTIDLSQRSYVYDSSKKEPEITVKDGQTVIENDQYTISWNKNLTDVGTHTVTITSTNKNYTFNKITDKVEIVAATQDALSITGVPSKVYYGDIIALSTTGGTGDGTVAWSITAGSGKATIDNAGTLTVKDTGTITVKAVRSVSNYKTVEATCNIIAAPKPVTAVVTVAPKDYDDTNNIADGAIIANVRSSDLVNISDKITISGLTGTYNDANVGENKPVTLNSSTASVGGADANKYSVSYPATATGNITAKKVTPTVTLSGNDLKGTPGTYHYDFDGTEKTPTVTVTDSDGTLIPGSNYTISYDNNKNVSTADKPAKVTVTANADGNYAFDAVEVKFTIEKAQAALTSSPQAKDLTYTGQPQDLVTIGTASGGKVVYSLQQGSDYKDTVPQKTDAGTYTVYYKIELDGNYDGSTSPWSVSVTIKPKPVNHPVITLDPDSFDRDGYFVYDGSAKKPSVTSVKDKDDVIPAEEYGVSYGNNINAGTATVTVKSISGGNYSINESVTFEIKKAKAAFTTAPTPVKGLTYNGAAQPLVNPGTPKGGTAVYSLDNVSYSAAIPTGINRGNYTVWAKVLGDLNHEDSEPIKVTDASDASEPSIGAKSVTPTVELSSTSFTYTGSEQKPTITVRDEGRNVIPTNEYEVAYSDSPVKVDTYTITVTSKGPNYHFDDITSTFTIVEANQASLTITGKPSVVYYGDTIQLSTAGGSGNGTVTWSIEAGNDKVDAATGVDGQFKIKGVGSITITATRKATDSSYADAKDTWTFSANKKPVTAVVTAKDKVYDTFNTADLTAKIESSDLVAPSDAGELTATGKFEDSDVGTNKTVTITGLTIPTEVSAKYDVTYPATTTASIIPATATAPDVKGENDLAYTGSPQNLVSFTSTDGTMVVYSLDGTTYSPNIPTGTDAGRYRVWFKALANGNYTDSAPTWKDVEIAKQTVTPTIELTPSKAQYDGDVKKPKVVVKDNNGLVIPESEYTVEYSPDEDWKDVSSLTNIYKVIVKDNTNKVNGNYNITEKEEPFEIFQAGQNPLSITNQPTGVIRYGDIFTLSAVGGSGNGAVTWKSNNTGIATVDNNGLVTIKDVGSVTITAEKAATQNYSKSTATYQFTVVKKPITATVTADDKEFNGTTDAVIHVVWESGGLVGTDKIELVGAFENANAGENKIVKITVKDGAASQKYAVTIPTVTANISKIKATAPNLTANSLIYSGSAQALVTDGDENTLYSNTENGVYTATAPTGTNAGEYKFWYKAEGDANHFDSDAKTISVTIAKATPTITPSTIAFTSQITLDQLFLNAFTAKIDGVTENISGTFTWDNGNAAPQAGQSYQVTFTPDTDYASNYNIVTIPVTVTNPPAPPTEDSSGGTSSDDPVTNDTGNSTPTPSAPMQTSVSNGTATTVLNASATDKLVKDAVANQSKNVVIKPEITSGVTKTQVSLPASTVSRLNNETSADLTVSTPVADVAIPNAALGTLSSAGGTVNVVTEQVEENKVSLTLTAGGKTVDSVPGGVKLTVPVEDAAPGTVAVLVREDGTRETIRKSVAGSGELSIPLDGSATVEIVDNSKEFADVSSTAWEADAVAFASAHELFNGTSETTFSPEQPMSRAMLATVLYNLEGSPDHSLTDAFNDVDSDTWYAESVSWAAENGITNGNADGQFAPNDSITREQFAVMLWRYAGSPAPNSQALNFTDADQASGYAVDALRWAAENGILNGHSDGRLDPGGLTTRAQAAQMLKNFMENT